MRNLLISLTFIFTLILFSSTDVYSQIDPTNRGNGSLVDVFGRTFYVTPGALNIPLDVRYKIVVEVSEGKNGIPFIDNEYDYSPNQSMFIVPTDAEEAMLEQGNYYVRVYFVTARLGGFHEEY